MFYLVTDQANRPLAHVDVDITEGPSTGYTFTEDEAEMLVYFNRASAKYPVDQYRLEWVASVMLGNQWAVRPRSRF